MTTKPASPVDSHAPSYVLPTQKRSAPDVIVVPPRAESGLLHRSSGSRVLGDRFLALAECQQQFLAELRARLTVLDGAIAEDSRARLKGALRDVVHVLDWCDSVQTDLELDSRRVAAGLEPIDLLELCGDVVAAIPEAGPIHVTGGIATPWWGEAAQLAAAVRHGLQLVVERTGGVGARQVEVGATDGSPWIRITGSGEPGDSVEVDSVRRFRQAVASLDARVVPDAMGPGGTGLVLHLPAAATEVGAS